MTQPPVNQSRDPQPPTQAPGQVGQPHDIGRPGGVDQPRDLDQPRGVGQPRTFGDYTVVVATFCALLLVSNIAAAKLFEFGPLVFDGGAVVFPLTYILGDVLAEVFGFRAARRAIVVGFILAAVACLTFWLVQLTPPAQGWENQAAFEAVLGFVPRIVAASLAGYLVGQLLNAAVLVRIKRRMAGRGLWVRLLASTLVGELADTLVFCTVAYLGVIINSTFVIYAATGYIYKCVIEIVFLPLTYRVIALMRRRSEAAGQVA